MPAVKFCGLTRAEDAALAAALGATYAGVIFAGGPRLLDAGRARAVLAPLPDGVRRVGVFGRQSPSQIAADAARAGLDVVQLHAVSDPEEIALVRHEMAAAVVPVEVWAVARVADGVLPARFAELARAADALVVDSLVTGSLGGTGVTTDWPRLADSLELHGRPRKLVLAGGLDPGNVARAIELLAPDVVDVSSGVERPGGRPGHKDPARMRAFAGAVLHGSHPSPETVIHS